MMRSPAIVAALAIGLAAASIASSALAAPPPTQVTVRLADLDLASPVGAHTALARLTRAASQACSRPEEAQSVLLRLSDNFRRCRTNALAAAVAQVPGTAIVAAYDEARDRPLQLAGR
ncbi:MAG TPA: UrcA family protein [Phenylobacterium sp.]|jgi:UrcA family protein|nr:UrcA family protein [Phenylobacterium sp.]